MTNLEAIKALLTQRVIQKVNEGTISKRRAKKLIVEGILNLTGTKVVEKIREDEESNKPSKWKKVARVAGKGAIYAGGALAGHVVGKKLGAPLGALAGGAAGGAAGGLTGAGIGALAGGKRGAGIGSLVGGGGGGTIGASAGGLLGYGGSVAGGLVAAHKLNKKLFDAKKKKEEATQQINKQMAAKKKTKLMNK